MQHNPSQRILFVSNTRLSVSLRRKLNARGFAVTLEATGREAVDQLTRSSFDIIVFDLVSTANANELIKRIRKVATFRAIPIIVVGDWGTGQVSLALSAGADTFAPAPIDASRLIEAIARLPKKRAAVAGKGH
jgi:DNA-binding response OmpR family regulator